MATIMASVGDQNRLLSLDEAKDFLNVSRSKLYLLMESGELPYVKLGKCRRVRMAALLALIEEHTCEGRMGPR
jgi:excisionase family DNA binding protein